MFIVYRALHPSTGMCYVGSTGQKLHERRAQHTESAMSGSPAKFHKALRRLGTQSWLWSTLSTHSTRASAEAAEAKAVRLYSSYRSGYNSTPDGLGKKRRRQASTATVPDRPASPPKPRRMVFERSSG